MAAVPAVIVLVTLVLMTTGRAPAVLALVCALVIAGLLGIATPNELFAGLSNGADFAGDLSAAGRQLGHSVWLRSS